MLKLTLKQLAKILDVKPPECANKTCIGVSIDTRTLTKGNLFIAIKGEQLDGHQFVEEAVAKGAAAVVVEKPVSISCPVFVVQDAHLAFAKIGGAWRRRFKIPVIALTGSCGKTTVKEMIASVLSLKGKTLATSKNLNNELGVPLTLCQLDRTHQAAVIEIGASKKGDIAYLMQFVKPTIALVTNAAPAHLLGFGSIEGVAEAKGEIYHGLGEEGVAIVNRDDLFFDYWCSVNKAFNQNRRIVAFGLTQGSEITAKRIQFSGGCCSFDLGTPQGAMALTVPLPGRHNVLNALAAAAVGYVCDMPTSLIREGLMQTKPIPGRLCVQKTNEGAFLVDDTYNANLASVRAAMEFLVSNPEEKILVLGDLAELGDEAPSIHTQLGREAQSLGISYLYTLGRLSQFTSRVFPGAEHFVEVEALISSLKKRLRPGVMILVKGSRASSMERVVKALTRNSGFGTRGS